MATYEHKPSGYYIYRQLAHKGGHAIVAGPFREARKADDLCDVVNRRCGNSHQSFYVAWRCEAREAA